MVLTETLLATPSSGVPVKTTAAIFVAATTGTPDNGEQKHLSVTTSTVSTSNKDNVPANKNAVGKPRRTDFVNYLVDAATQVIESIWPTPPTTTGCVKLLPLRLFVQEVLRRSRTSYVTLQTALFYLTIVKDREWRTPVAAATAGVASKQGERHGLSVSFGMSSFSSTNSDSNNSAALDAINIETNMDHSGIITPPNSQRGSSPTVPQRFESKATSQITKKQHPEIAVRSTAEKPIPSRTATSSTTASDPRQCGRRMFLASLVIATKYLQDRAYSNRAWSRVSGLLASEITRCERKLLQWLDWELHIPHDDFTKWQAELLARVQAASGNTMTAKTTVASLVAAPAPIATSEPLSLPQVAIAPTKTPTPTTNLGAHSARQHHSTSIDKQTLLQVLSAATTHSQFDDYAPISPTTPNRYGLHHYGRLSGYGSLNLSSLSKVIQASNDNGRKRGRSIEMGEEILRDILTQRPRTVNPVE